MKALRSVGLIALGVVLGAVIVAWARPVLAQLPAYGPQPRITEKSANSVAAGSVSFLHDSVSNGCWIVVRITDTRSLAPAPAAACN